MSAFYVLTLLKIGNIFTSDTQFLHQLSAILITNTLNNYLSLTTRP